MQGKKILVIDDDANLCQVVEVALVAAGAIVFIASNGKKGLQLFFAHRPDLVILDIRMPVMDGWETCRQIRLLSDIPIIMLTTMDADDDIVRGLDYGADDFITKPFGSSVLKARIRAVLRRAESASEKGQSSYIYTDDHLRVDIEKRQVHVQGEPVRLTATEFQLLAYLLQNGGQVLTYQQILENVWGVEYRDSVDYVHVYLSHLRRKLEEDPRQPKYFLTEHGVGYRFNRQIPS